ncbi:MAG: DUF2304 domain-containing protein [Chloroflexi bacterium]|uniref:DUF2304 domain-containing protein n=1 Tax=Candidatus Chlorohelix allophototropha TaxID=3003348 RepID=A0A8T7M682_9CHLR|nr:DUF2304 domain-containing protein [Chloroflexota bacterium]WJW69528.1 DUF2304 domain-containing protein [Chloroflexota bacterium L227-S17]
MISQFVFLSGLLILLIYVFRFRSLLTDRIIYLSILLVGIIAVIYPELTTAIAKKLEIGRGADLIFYSFIIFSLFQMFNQASHYKKMEAQITSLIRNQAISNPMEGISDKITAQVLMEDGEFKDSDSSEH